MSGSFSLCAGLLILIGLDLKISTERWKQGVRDLNPLLQYSVKNHGILGGSAALLLSNFFLLFAIYSSPLLLAILFGAKLSLATLQIRSKIEINKGVNKWPQDQQ